jgi:hypothetical protein
MSLDDRRGRFLRGLTGGGGWTINGGLVDRTHQNGVTVELFGFKVLKWYNAFAGGYYKYKEMVYEFYLVGRYIESKRGNIQRRWTIGYDDIIFQPYEQDVRRLQREVDQGVISKRDMEKTLNDPGNRAENIEGYLDRPETQGEVEVTIKGLKQEFRHTVTLNR